MKMMELSVLIRSPTLRSKSISMKKIYSLEQFDEHSSRREIVAAISTRNYLIILETYQFGNFLIFAKFDLKSKEFKNLKQFFLPKMKGKIQFSVKLAERKTNGSILIFQQKDNKFYEVFCQNFSDSTLSNITMNEINFGQNLEDAEYAWYYEIANDIYQERIYAIDHNWGILIYDLQNKTSRTIGGIKQGQILHLLYLSGYNCLIMDVWHFKKDFYSLYYLRYKDDELNEINCFPRGSKYIDNEFSHELFAWSGIKFGINIPRKGEIFSLYLNAFHKQTITDDIRDLTRTGLI